MGAHTEDNWNSLPNLWERIRNVQHDPRTSHLAGTELNAVCELVIITRELIRHAQHQQAQIDRLMLLDEPPPPDESVSRMSGREE